MTGRPIAMRILAELGRQRRAGRRVVAFWLHRDDLAALEHELMDGASFSDMAACDSAGMRFLGVPVSADLGSLMRGGMSFEWESE